MSTLDTVFLGIIAFFLSLFFLLSSVAVVFLLKLISSVRKVTAKAEEAIESVEEAAETVKNIGANTEGPLALFKLIQNIVNLKKRRK